MGQTLGAARGIEDGLQVLDLLATDPSTARFICSKLCRRFVSDAPPPELIESSAQVFLQTDGDIRSILKHIFMSKGFIASAGQKLRRPLDICAALLRVLQPAFRLHDTTFLLNQLEPMGQLPFMWHPPNGYPDAAAAWINTNGMLYRWNLAMLLPRASEDWFEAAEIDLNQLIPASPNETVGDLIDKTTQRLLGGTVQAQDRAQLIFFMSDFGDAEQPVDADLRAERLPSLMGLILASPYFQWS